MLIKKNMEAVEAEEMHSFIQKEMEQGKENIHIVLHKVRKGKRI